jgi:hypothetical protein
MTSTIIVLLLALSGWLAVKLTMANKANSDLQIRVDSLKRQLVRMR